MKLENSYLCVEIAEKGAEVTSILNKKTGAEVLWSGDPKYWGRHSPVLFPNVGKTHGNTVRINGEQYPTTQHGFARDSVFTCVKLSDTEAKFLLVSSEETREVYPFDFELYITYTLNGKELNVNWRVKNPSDETMYFTIGAHPAFMYEKEGETKQDYLLYFPGMDRLSCVGLDIEHGTGAPEKGYTLELDQGYLELNDDLFAMDTLIMDEEQIKEAWICRKSDRTPYAGVRCPGFISFGIWSVKNSPFVCLEPWAGRCDDGGFDRDISEKPGINAVEAGKEFKKEYQIIVG